MGLRVMTRDGRAPTVNAVSVRTVLRLIDDGPIGLIVMVASGKRCQRIGDLLAGTTVGRAVGEVPRPQSHPLLAIYPAAWLIGALVFITLPSSASAEDYRARASEICRLGYGPEQWAPIMQEMYSRHAALKPPKELEHVHAVLLQTDAALHDVFRQIQVAREDPKVVRRLLPIEAKAMQDGRDVVAPELPDCWAAQPGA
jgi:hypothetical protein